MKSWIGAPLLAAIGLCATPAIAATSDSQLWTNFNVNVKLADRWRLSEEGTVRFSDNRGGLYELEVNSLLGYRLNKVTTLWAGYTHNPQYSSGDFTVMEHRAREQVTFDGFAKLGTGKLNGRIRLEQRWREGADGTGWRVRPYLKTTLPLTGGGRTALVISSEAFLNLNNAPFQRSTGFDRVRNLVAISTSVSNKVSVEAGYLNQYTAVRNGPDSDDHVASFTLSTSF
jgi:hypothetical protein